MPRPPYLCQVRQPVRSACHARSLSASDTSTDSLSVAVRIAGPLGRRAGLEVHVLLAIVIERERLARTRRIHTPPDPRAAGATPSPAGHQTARSVLFFLDSISQGLHTG